MKRIAIATFILFVALFCLTMQSDTELSYTCQLNKQQLQVIALLKSRSDTPANFISAEQARFCDENKIRSMMNISHSEPVYNDQ